MPKSKEDELYVSRSHLSSVAAYVIGLPRRMDRHELSNVGRLLWKMMEVDGRRPH
jgi:hypothetical protein